MLHEDLLCTSLIAADIAFHTFAPLNLIDCWVSDLEK